MTLKKIKKNKGFVILFAVTISAILLSIALGVASIARQEIKFGTSAKDTDNAFYAADTGIECAEINDKTTPNYFPVSGPATKITCASSTANNITPVFTSATNSYDFVVTGLGTNNASCAKVNIKKMVNADSSVSTTIIAKGYNIGDETCSSTDPNRIERELQVSYSAGSSSLLVPPAGTSGTITLTTDNQYTAYFNGASLGSGADWGTAQVYNNVQFQTGQNTIALQAVDSGGCYAGVLADINVGSGSLQTGTSTTWKVSTSGPAGWQNPGFDDSTWASAVDDGAYGVAPWGLNVTNMPSSTPGHWIWNAANQVACGGGTLFLRGIVNMSAPVTPISFRSSSTASTAGATSLTISPPSGLANNDVMIAIINANVETTTITPPSGWTLIRSLNNNNPPITANASIYYKRAASESGSYRFDISSSQRIVGAISAFSGVITSGNPVDVSSGQSNNSSATATAPSITTTRNNEMLVYASVDDNSPASTWTAPSGMTEAADSNSTAAVTIDYLIQASAGATGNKVGACTDAGLNGSFLLGLIPAN
jgi:hypothetical protein